MRSGNPGGDASAATRREEADVLLSQLRFAREVAAAGSRWLPCSRKGLYQRREYRSPQLRHRYTSNGAAGQYRTSPTVTGCPIACSPQFTSQGRQGVVGINNSAHRYVVVLAIFMPWLYLARVKTLPRPVDRHASIERVKASTVRQKPPPCGDGDSRQRTVHACEFNNYGEYSHVTCRGFRLLPPAVGARSVFGD